MSKTEYLMVKIEPELKAEVIQEAKKQHMSMSDFVRRVIRQWIENKKQGKPSEIIW